MWQLVFRAVVFFGGIATPPLGQILKAGVCFWKCMSCYI